MRKLTLLATLALALALPSSAAADPALELATSHDPPSSQVPAGTYAVYEIAVSNPGADPTSATTEVNATVPAGLEITTATDETDGSFGAPLWDCAIAPDAASASCEGVDPSGALGGPYPIPAGGEACAGLGIGTCRVLLIVKADKSVPAGTTLAPTITACGGGASTCPTPAATTPEEPIEVIPFDFRVTEFDGRALRGNGDPATQAGSHPDTAFTEFFLNSAIAGELFQQLGGKHVAVELPTEQLRDVAVDLPPGLLGNPQAYPTCTQAQLAQIGDIGSSFCPPESQVGTVTLWFNGSSLTGGGPGHPTSATKAVYNMQTPKGTAASPIGTPGLFAFNYLGARVQIYADLRTGTDNGVTVTSKNAPQTLTLAGVTFEFWGVPADPGHDAERFCPGSGLPGCATEAPLRPFLTLPTSCTGPVDTTLEAISWHGSSGAASFTSHDNDDPPNPIGGEGCEFLPFAPTMNARPTTNAADAPSGLDVDLHIPQDTFDDPFGVTAAHLKKVEVTLPEGLVVNPASANGLGACSPGQIGLTSDAGQTPATYTRDPAHCPDSSRLASVEATTPLLDHPIQGSVYLAEPHRNPFGSLLALYLYLEDYATGTFVKLAGEVSPDPSTGQLTAVFDRNPQVPVEDISIDFFGGAAAALRTPAVCGEYTTASTLTSWAGGPPVGSPDTWQISQGASGGGCTTSAQNLSHSPGFDAGSAGPTAGRYAPFVVNLRRGAGSQAFAAVKLTPPPGLTAKLAATPDCPESALAAAAARPGRDEQASPSCPAASRVGSVHAAAGAGPAPYWASGAAYLAGPYKGAPLSLAIVVPAVAGPFDLGTVVVRTALRLDPRTAQITAVSDDIPAILQGIPLDVREASIRLDKPEFTLNPTSCEEMQIGGELRSVLGAVASLQERFQLAECSRLGFKPRLRLRLFGKHFRRGANPRLLGIALPRPGDANISRVAVKMPPSIFVDQSHIRTVCTRVQFAADACPKGSVYGHARAWTPLLAEPLSGPVYLRSSDNPLPDLVADLNGRVRVEVVARTDSVKGALRNVFEIVPDAPVSRFVLMLQGGRKSLLVASRNLCRGVHRARVNLAAHNGVRRVLRRRIEIPRCRKLNRVRKRRAKRRAQRRKNARRASLSAARRSG